MKGFKDLFLRNKQKTEIKKESNDLVTQYEVIGRLLREARIQKNLSIQELSRISKIPEYTIRSIENNIDNVRPKFPFIRSILSKLEDCLSLKKDSLVGLLIKESNSLLGREKRKFILRKFDFFNTFQGSLLYFLILISIIFTLKRYFFSEVTIIEIQNVEEKIKQK